MVNVSRAGDDGPWGEVGNEFARLVRRHDIAQMLAMDGDDLDTFTVEVLAAIEQAAPVRASRLAEQFSVTRTVVSRKVAPLLADGLVVAHPDPADGRAALLELSESGRAELERHRRYRQSVFAAVFADWDGREVKRFVAQLRRFNDAAQKLPGRPAKVLA